MNDPMVLVSEYCAPKPHKSPIFTYRKRYCSRDACADRILHMDARKLPSGRSRQMAMRACINCQRRKARCLRRSSGTGPCSYCSRTGKACSIEDPPDRTPLTRKNLDLAELRCAQLRSLLQSLNPDVDIDSALASLESDRNSAASQPPETNDEAPPHSYEWHEDSPSAADDSIIEDDDAIGNDGMATLSRADAGYLGITHLTLYRD